MAGVVLEFFINDFNTEITLDISGQLDSYDVSLGDTDCVADLYVDTQVLRETFKFQTDSNDVTDAMNDDIKYFTFRDKFWTHDPSHSFSINVADAVQHFGDTNVQIFNSPNIKKNMACHDFTRYLSDSLFNTHKGVDLFNNEDELLNDIRLKSQKAWATMDKALTKWDVEARDLTGVSLHGVSYDPQVTKSGDYDGGSLGFLRYYNDDPSTDTDDNICMSILKQLAYHQPQRFRTILSSPTQEELHSIPFVEGDIISMKLTITPAANQHLLVGLAQPIQPRTYKIRFNLVDNYATSYTKEVTRENDESSDYRTLDTATDFTGVLAIV